nr:hypothetical protein [Oscillospiraceae bacterium]
MKNTNMGFNPEGVASLNELLEARELTGQIPETMPIGIKAKNREHNSSNADCGYDCIDFCNENCNCDCDCDPDDPQCDCECECGGFCQCDCDSDCSTDG